MKRIEPYAYFQQNGKVYLLEFSIEKGKYDLIGQYDAFYEEKDIVVLTNRNVAYFTVVFMQQQKVCKAIQGTFVGFKNGLVCFEDSQKNLYIISENRDIRIFP